MTPAALRHLPLSVALSVAAAALGCATLAFSSTDTLLDRGFTAALGTVTTNPTGISPLRDEAESARVAGNAVLLSALDHTRAAQQAARSLGDKLTMSVEGGKPLELEVVGITEIPLSASLGTTPAQTPPRLLMLTCRELTDNPGQGRLVRLIVEADEPLLSGSARNAARVL